MRRSYQPQEPDKEANSNESAYTCTYTYIQSVRNLLLKRKINKMGNERSPKSASFPWIAHYPIIGNSEPMEVSELTNIRGVTETREGVVTDKELIEKIMALNKDDFKHPYYYMRIIGLCSLARRTGKRREELGLLKFSDIETSPDHIRIIFTLMKKRKSSVYYARSPPKLIERGDLISEWIVGYLDYLKDLCPECVWVFPKTFYSELTGTFKIYPAKRLQGRQLLNIVKRLDPTLWCHLFRDSLGADIVKKYKGDVVSVYEVQRILDLERTSTAFRYLRRYAEQKIGRPPE